MYYENTKVLKIIERIRNSFDNAEEVYTNGSCVKFCMILLEIMPEGKILYDINHAIFEYNGRTYDISGYAKKNKNHVPIEDYGILKAYDIMSLTYKNNK